MVGLTKGEALCQMKFDMTVFPCDSIIKIERKQSRGQQLVRQNEGNRCCVLICDIFPMNGVISIGLGYLMIDSPRHVESSSFFKHVLLNGHLSFMKVYSQESMLCLVETNFMKNHNLWLRNHNP